MNCVCLSRSKFEFHTVKKNELTTKVLWKFDETPPNIIFPTTVAIVGRINAPHRTLVADTGSRRGAGSAGVLKPVSEMKGISLCSDVLSTNILKTLYTESSAVNLYIIFMSGYRCLVQNQTHFTFITFWSTETYHLARNS